MSGCVIVFCSRPAPEVAPMIARTCGKHHDGWIASPEFVRWRQQVRDFGIESVQARVAITDWIHRVEAEETHERLAAKKLAEAEMPVPTNGAIN